MGVGMGVLGFSIAFMTINERRDLRQKEFRERGEKVCKTIDVTGSLGYAPRLAGEPDALPDDALVGTIGRLTGLVGDPKLPAVQGGTLVHAVGMLTVEGCRPRDPWLQVNAVDGLRLSRDAEMYQWEETEREETVEKNGKTHTEVYYTYDKVWSRKPLTCSHSFAHDNPEFPPNIGEMGYQVFDGEKLVLGDKRVRLSQEMVELCDDFEPLQLVEAKIEDQEDLLTIVSNGGLRVIGCALYSASGSPTNPQVGDVRIFYQHVKEGVHTLISQWDNSDLEPGGLFLPLDDSLEDGELGDMAEISVGQEAQDFAKRVGYKTFVIPEAVIDYAEDVLLDIAPVRLACIRRGELSVEQIFDDIEEDDENLTTVLRLAGAALCVVSTCLVTSPFLASSFGGVAAVGTGALIALQTITQAREQINADPADDEVLQFLQAIVGFAGVDSWEEEKQDTEKDGESKETLADELSKLRLLHEQGALTDEGYSAAKAAAIANQH